MECVTIDGHDLKIIDAAIEQCKATKGRPSVIVMDTVKGKGCSVAEKAASTTICATRRRTERQS